MKITITRTAKVKGRYVRPGTEVDVSDSRAQALRRSGKAVPARSKASAKKADE